jgi:6-bladed beta-propeller
MKTISSIFLFLIIMVIYCCKSNEKFNHDLINLENVAVENIKISTIADSIYYIKLETSNECLIKHIQKIEVDKELIFILDNNERLLLFDRDGKFLNQIGKIGKGPGEYTNINDFSIDSINNIAYILDGRQILGYNYSGRFNNIQISVNRCINFFYNNHFFYCYTPSELYFTGSSNEYNIHVLDSTGSKIMSFLPVPNIKRELPMFVSTGQFYSFDHELFLMEQNSNKVYKLGANGISIKYEFINGSNMYIPNQTDPLFLGN